MQKTCQHTSLPERATQKTCVQTGNPEPTFHKSCLETAFWSWEVQKSTSHSILPERSVADLRRETGNPARAVNDLCGDRRLTGKDIQFRGWLRALLGGARVYCPTLRLVLRQHSHVVARYTSREAVTFRRSKQWRDGVSVFASLGRAKELFGVCR